MKILWHSNAPFAPTGYGQQTALFAPLLAEDFDVALSSFYGLSGAPLGYEGIKVYPGLDGQFGNETIPWHAKHFFGDLRDGLVFTLMDVWVLNPAVMTQVNMASWVPVDHDPVPVPVDNFFRHSGAVPVAMSRFGAERLAGHRPFYVPHGVDTDKYRPRGVQESRRALGLPEDAFIVGMVAANKGNPSRKCFVEAFQAFRRLLNDHPEAFLYLHTECTGRFDGVNLIRLLEAVGIPESNYAFTDQYSILCNPPGQQVMSTVFSTFDVLLNAAAGEGFGITPLEAQACGVPCVVTDFTAMPEVTGAGWHVPFERVYTNLGSWQAKPDVAAIHAALEECFVMPEKQREALSIKARKHAETYEVARVYREFMKPAVDGVLERLQQREPVTA